MLELDIVTILIVLIVVSCLFLRTQMNNKISPDVKNIIFSVSKIIYTTSYLNTSEIKEKSD